MHWFAVCCIKGSSWSPNKKENKKSLVSTQGWQIEVLMVDGKTLCELPFAHIKYQFAVNCNQVLEIGVCLSLVIKLSLQQNCFDSIWISEFNFMLCIYFELGLQQNQLSFIPEMCWICNWIFRCCIVQCKNGNAGHA